LQFVKAAFFRIPIVVVCLVLVEWLREQQQHAWHWKSQNGHEKLLQQSREDELMTILHGKTSSKRQ